MDCTCVYSNWPGGSAVYIADPNCKTHGDNARLAAARDGNAHHAQGDAE